MHKIIWARASGGAVEGRVSTISAAPRAGERRLTAQARRDDAFDEAISAPLTVRQVTEATAASKQIIFPGQNRRVT